MTIITIFVRLAKFDADCGAETSFPLTLALGGSTVVLLRNMTYLQPFPLNLQSALNM